jgi:hypothetical protein
MDWPWERVVAARFPDPNAGYAFSKYRVPWADADRAPRLLPGARGDPAGRAHDGFRDAILAAASREAV